MYVPINDMNDTGNGRRARSESRASGIHAVDARTGKVLWSHVQKNVCPPDLKFCDPGISSAVTATPGACSPDISGLALAAKAAALRKRKTCSRAIGPVEAEHASKIEAYKSAQKALILAKNDAEKREDSARAARATIERIGRTRERLEDQLAAIGRRADSVRGERALEALISAEDKIEYRPEVAVLMVIDSDNSHAVLSEAFKLKQVERFFDASGVTVEQAAAEMRAIAGNVQRAYPKDYSNLRFPVVQLSEVTTGEIRPLLWVVSGRGDLGAVDRDIERCQPHAGAGDGKA
ncbi:MAG: hypothetical protein HC793_03050, partial [Aquincola sp.]|nr:hypothetical protein [Aquincola sp.]